MKKSILKMIVEAVDIIGEINWTEPDRPLETTTYEVPKEFKGYISAFGASIIQAGLIPTLAFYSDKDADAKSDRWILLQALAELIGKQREWREKWQLEDGQDVDERILLDYALSLQKDTDDKWQKGRNQKEFRRLKAIIIDAAIALKLALRTYRLTTTD